ncbi:MAG TPA: HlyD family efflux transporter periplasmic adaptor subunit [Thermoanaerobaculia bacterium]
MKKRIIPIVIVILVSAIVAGIAFARRSEKNPNELHLAGNIELDEVDVSFRIAGRVVERTVGEGSVVQAGQIVARLDAADLEHDVALRRAEAAAAEAQLAGLQSGTRVEQVAQAAAAVEQARAVAARTASEYERSRELLQKDVISRREFEAAQSAHRSAQAALEQASQQHALLRKGPREEEIAQTRAQVDRAREAIAAAGTRTGWTTAVAPIGGTVLTAAVEPGEQVAPGMPVVTIGNLDRIWLRAYVDERDLGRVRLNTPVVVRSDTYPDKRYRGRITWISDEAEFTPKSVQTEKERVKLVYRIKVAVENPNHELKPGMPADAIIQVGPAKR